MITGVDFSIIPVTDIEASRRFYGEVLGLQESKQWGSMPAFEYETGNLTLALVDLAAFGQEFRPNGGAVALQVEDVAAARAELESRGVTFYTDIIDSGVCHQSYFNDPDGNPLGIHHRYAPKS
jgi:catechol 2,3-dioxygenase-like lactoylglutathione lyase family enzyme